MVNQQRDYVGTKTAALVIRGISALFISNGALKSFIHKLRQNKR